jgi:hypothetical protein
MKWKKMTEQRTPSGDENKTAEQSTPQEMRIKWQSKAQFSMPCWQTYTN